MYRKSLGESWEAAGLLNNSGLSGVEECKSLVIELQVVLDKLGGSESEPLVRTVS